MGRRKADKCIVLKNTIRLEMHGLVFERTVCNRKLKSQMKLAHLMIVQNQAA